MNGINFETHKNPTEKVERTYQDMNFPMVTTPEPADEDVLQETAPVNEWQAKDTAAIPMDGTIIQETPAGETIIYKDNVSTNTLLQSTTGQLAQETSASAAPVTSVPKASLLGEVESESLRVRWSEIQGKFVDEPRTAVQQADSLVSDVVEQITKMFADERSVLEGQWKQGSDVSTEDLRQALQRYRTFFNRLVV